jgi:hypothetical protein
MVGTQHVGGKIWYAGHNIKDKAITRKYIEKQLYLEYLDPEASYLLCAINSRYDKVNHLAKTIGYFTQS